MQKPAALAGSALFFAIAPGVLAGVIPWQMTGWTLGPPLLGLGALRWLGGALIAAGVPGVVACFARFAIQGLGTPAPLAPPEHLVVSGLYRHVRNPIYVSLVSVILGQALLFGDVSLFPYAAALWLAFHGFVVLSEEPILRHTFGAEYAAYCTHVGRWWPRLRPWQRDGE